MTELTPAQVARLLQADPRAVLLDVREPWEVALARVALPPAQSLAIPLGALPARAGEIPRTQPVVCICHHGVRSAQAVAFMRRGGRGEVYNLAGGIDAWSTAVDATVPRY